MEIPLKCPAKFVVAMIPDGRGGVYVAGEDRGIWHGQLAATVKHDRLTVRAHWTRPVASDGRGPVSNCLTALCVDGRGRLWAGTNRHGVCVYNGQQWKNYNIINGPLGSHVYAIAYDRPANQLWIATENGLSIYQCGGELGAQISSLSRTRKMAAPQIPHYAPHTWHYLYGAHTPGPNPDCIAFDSRGTAFVGTQCNGLDIGTPRVGRADNPTPEPSVKYQWRHVAGPWRMPETAYGSGLSSDLINAVLVTPRNHVLVATGLGLAVSNNAGRTFRYERGRDYAAKVLGLWHPPVGFHRPSKATLNRLLPGDHVTCVARDLAGHIWLGTWRNGYEALNQKTGQAYKSEEDPSLAQADGYISRICLVNVKPAQNHGARPKRSRQKARRQPVQMALVGRYGFGVTAFARLILGKPTRSNASSHGPVISTTRPARFPSPAPAPSAGELKPLRRPLETATKQAGKIHYPWAAALPPDWVTQGDWVGRYGYRLAILCCGNWPLDASFSGDYNTETVHGFNGPHYEGNDCLREWQAWADTDQPRCLYMPDLGYRRQANWDDHGENYKYTFNGPDLWLRVRLKNPGLYRVSLYFVNKDGHTGANRQRDWLVDVYPLPKDTWRAMASPLLAAEDWAARQTAQRVRQQKTGRPTARIPPPRIQSNPLQYPMNRPALDWARRAMAGRPLAEARVVNFWSGVYSRFLLAGPGQYMIRLERNGSLNTEISGIFIDPADTPPPAEKIIMIGDTRALLPPPRSAFAVEPQFGGLVYEAPKYRWGGAGSTSGIAVRLWRAAIHAYGPAAWGNRRLAQLLNYRYAAAHGAPAALLANWRWKLDLWTSQDRQTFDQAMNEQFAAFLRTNPAVASWLVRHHCLQPNSGKLGERIEP